MPINHRHHPAVIPALHTSSANQTAPHVDHPPSPRRKQLTQP